jgi:hypothetical protein
VAFNDPTMRDIANFDAYRDALRQAVKGETPSGKRKRRRAAPRSSTPERDAARLRAQRDTRQERSN